MKIAISTLSGFSYGGLTYFTNLIPSLAKVDKDNEYHIFVSDNNPFVRSIRQDNFFFYECSKNTQSALSRFLWEQLALPWHLKKRKIDILFTAKNMNVFLAPCKTIISIRNMEPFCYRQYQNEWKLNCFSWLKKLLSGFSMRKANKIIAVSNFVEEYLKKHFPFAIDKISVIYNGNPIMNRHSGAPPFKETTPYLLSASKFVAYANQLHLVRGYSRLYRRNKDIPALWLAGGVHDKLYFQKINEFIKEERLTKEIKILGLVPRDRLTELYKNSFAFLFPSCLEACPQTLIEAMTCGSLIATSKVSPMPEICEDAAIYFDPYDEKDIADKMEMLLNDEKLRQRLKEASLKRSQFFDWDKTALGICAVFETLKA